MLTQHVIDAQNVELSALRELLRQAEKNMTCWREATANCPDCQKLFKQLMEGSK